MCLFLIQAIGCIRNGENMLLSNIIPGFSLAEAKDSIMEYEQFKTAMEVCSVFLVCGSMAWSLWYGNQ